MMRTEVCPPAIDAMRLLLWCAAACSSASGLRYTAVLSTNGLRYSAVLPSPNPRAPVNNDARGRIRRLIGRVDKSELGGRVFFDPRDDAPPRKEWHRVLRGPLSVRIVAADLPSYATRAGVLPSVPDASNLADALLEHTEWRAALDAWTAFGNAVTAPLPAHVRCKRHTTAVWAPAGISPPLRRALALRLPEALTPEPRRERAAVEIQVTLHEDGVLVELLALKQRMDRDLPCPGFRRLESYVVAQAARIQPGDVVLDPFCGKATFLAEAELCWPGASMIGVDSDPAQLDAAAKNLGSNATLLHASATALPLEDNSVDAVVSCPPFDRQHTAQGGLDALYAESFAETRRVLRPTGRASLLLDENSLEIAQRHWPGLCVLGPMPLGPWVRTVLCAWPDGDAWEAWDRSAWARHRDAALPGLEPVWLL